MRVRGLAVAQLEPQYSQSRKLVAVSRQHARHSIQAEAGELEMHAR